MKIKKNYSLNVLRVLKSGFLFEFTIFLLLSFLLSFFFLSINSLSIFVFPTHGKHFYFYPFCLDKISTSSSSPPTILLHHVFVLISSCFGKKLGGWTSPFLATISPCQNHHLSLLPWTTRQPPFKCIVPPYKAKTKPSTPLAGGQLQLHHPRPLDELIPSLSFPLDFRLKPKHH